MGDLFSGGGGEQKATSTPDQWIQDASKRSIGYSEDRINKGYSPYTGQRSAGLSFDEQTASNLANQDRYSPWLQKAGEAAGRGEAASRKSVLDYDLKAYMNPYTKNVLDIGAREQDKAYQQKLQGLRGSAVSRGAFGSGRSDMRERELSQDFLQANGDLYTRGMADSYDKAMGAISGDRASEAAGAFGAAGQYGSIGSAMGGLTNQQIQALMTTGGAERGVRQGALDANYGEFLNGMNYDQNAINQMLAAIGASKYGTSGTQTGGGGNGAGQLLGLAATGLGAYMGGGGTFSDPRLKRDITRVGTHASGLPWYRFTYVWGEPSEGVMADEALRVRPGAVSAGPGGFLMVDYGKL